MTLRLVQTTSTVARSTQRRCGKPSKFGSRWSPTARASPSRSFKEGTRPTRPSACSSSITERVSGVKEWRRLALDFYSMDMELGEHPRQFFLRVDRLVKEMERVGRPTLEKDIDLVLRTGLSSQYDAEVRMLESSAKWPNHAWIERAVYNQYDGLTRETSEAGPKLLASVSRVVCPPEICQFCSQAGPTAANCRKLEYAKRKPKGNGKRACDCEAAKLIKMAQRPRTEVTRSCTA